jgi:hypothetical protein
MNTLAYRLSVDHPHPQGHPTFHLLYGTAKAVTAVAVEIIRILAARHGLAPVALSWSLERVA